MRKEPYLSAATLEIKTKEWSGAVRHYTKPRGNRFDPRKTCLLVIDMQHFFLDEKSHAFVPAGKAILPNIQQLIRAFREANRPVVFTRYALKNSDDPGGIGRWWKDIVREGSVDSAWVDEMDVRDGDEVIRKTTYRAFYRTPLERMLKARGIRNMVIAGVLTHLCCETTAREAFVRDFNVYFVLDGTATYTEELHLGSLRALAHGFALPVTTKEVVRQVGGVRR